VTLAAWPLDTVQDQLARRVCRNGARHEPLDERACMPMAWLRERFVTPLYKSLEVEQATG